MKMSQVICKMDLVRGGGAERTSARATSYSSPDIFLQVHLATVMLQLVHAIYNSFSGAGRRSYLCSWRYLANFDLIIYYNKLYHNSSSRS
jgi:hypothetical protein